ncbi:MAG: hypothetical protein ABGY96_28585 [bacterium]
MLVEIRSYHYDPDQFDAYRKWAVDHAVPYLKANLDVVGFWLDNGEPPEINGKDPMTPKHGTANVTWIIRWESMEKRNEGQKTIFAGKGWEEVFSQHPDPDGYLQLESRFAEEV